MVAIFEILFELWLGLKSDQENSILQGFSL